MRHGVDTSAATGLVRRGVMKCVMTTKDEFARTVALILSAQSAQSEAHTSPRTGLARSVGRLLDALLGSEPRALPGTVLIEARRRRARENRAGRPISSSRVG